MDVVRDEQVQTTHRSELVQTTHRSELVQTTYSTILDNESENTAYKANNGVNVAIKQEIPGPEHIELNNREMYYGTHSVPGDTQTHSVPGDNVAITVKQGIIEEVEVKIEPCLSQQDEAVHERTDIKIEQQCLPHQSEAHHERTEIKTEPQSLSHQTDTLPADIELEIWEGADHDQLHADHRSMLLPGLELIKRPTDSPLGLRTTGQTETGLSESHNTDKSEAGLSVCVLMDNSSPADNEKLKASQHVKVISKPQPLLNDDLSDSDDSDIFPTNYKKILLPNPVPIKRQVLTTKRPAPAAKKKPKYTKPATEKPVIKKERVVEYWSDSPSDFESEEEREEKGDSDYMPDSDNHSDDDIIPEEYHENYSESVPRTWKKKSRDGRTLLVCEECDYSTSAANIYSMISHRNKHAGVKPYKCDFEGCDFSSANPKSLRSHRRDVHIEGPGVPCPKCGDTLKGMTSLRTHLRLTHGVGEAIKVFRCSECDFKTRRQQVYIHHKRTHTNEKPFKCTECDYASTQQINLATHMRTHTGEKPYKCDQCDFAASHNVTLKGHRRTMHEDIGTDTDTEMESDASDSHHPMQSDSEQA